MKGANVFECVEIRKTISPQCEIADNKFNCGEICLEQSKICDGVINCVDRSDEIDCGKFEGLYFCQICQHEYQNSDFSKKRCSVITIK